MGKRRRRGRQGSIWVASHELPHSAGQPALRPRESCARRCRLRCLRRGAMREILRGRRRPAEPGATSLVTRTEMVGALERASAVTGWTKTRRGEADRKFLREWPDLGGVPVTDALVERADALAWEHGLRAYDSGSARGDPRVSRTWLDTGSAHARPDCSWKRCPIQTRYMWCSTNCAEFGAFRLPLTET